MNTLEGLLDSFARHASDDYLKQMEARKTFNGGLRVLKAYARKHLGVRTDSFNRAKRRSRRHYTGRLETIEDLWLLMVYKNDLQTDGPESSESSSVTTHADSSTSSSTLPTTSSDSSRPRRSFRPQKKIGFGVVSPGTGKTLSFPYRTKVAYFRDTPSGRRYRAEVHNGRVKFERFNFMKKCLPSIKEIGVPSFNVAWNLEYDDVPDDLFFSRIFKDRNKDMVDWAMALIASEDILISEDSKYGGYAPAKLVGSDKSAMYLSKSLSRAFLEGKKFLFNPRSKDLYWVPSDGPYLMKVKVTSGPYNTFERVHSRRIKHLSQFKDCVVRELDRQFV